MPNNFNLDITINDFENICRTCLSREGLKPLYNKYLHEMLMSCTVVKFAENDGLPAKICTNCINEINNAFSFAKRCETTDKILRKCVIELVGKVVYNSSNFQKIEPSSEGMEEVNEEEHVNMEFEENWIKVEAETKIECSENYDDPLNASNEEDRCTNSQIVEKNLEDDDCETYVKRESFEAGNNQHETFSEKPDLSGSTSKRRIEKSKSKDDCETNDNSADENFEEYDDEDQDKTYSEKSDNPGSRRKRQKGILTGEKSHVCEVCSKSFTESTYLKRHMRTHTGEKPYQCKVCSKGFALTENLTRHMKTHTEERPYRCEVCSKGFTRTENLIRHMKIHTEKKPYNCDVCSKDFSRNEYLQQHMRIHSGEISYTCKVCSKAFSQSSTLRIHMRDLYAS